MLLRDVTKRDYGKRGLGEQRTDSKDSQTNSRNLRLSKRIVRFAHAQNAQSHEIKDRWFDINVNHSRFRTFLHKERPKIKGEERFCCGKGNHSLDNGSYILYLCHGQIDGQIDRQSYGQRHRPTADRQYMESPGT